MSLQTSHFKLLTFGARLSICLDLSTSDTHFLQILFSLSTSRSRFCSSRKRNIMCTECARGIPSVFFSQPAVSNLSFLMGDHGVFFSAELFNEFENKNKIGLHLSYFLKHVQCKTRRPSSQKLSVWLQNSAKIKAAQAKQITTMTNKRISLLPQLRGVIYWGFSHRGVSKLLTTCVTKAWNFKTDVSSL